LEPGGGVELHATFYPSHSGKEAVPVVVLHMWKGSRSDFAPLIPVLQDQGFAILAPDLRGHGQSRRRLGPRGGGDALDAERLGPADFAAMVQYDMETWKRFLVEKNNSEAVNIEKLTIIGAEMGAAVALNWARLDWSWPQYPGVKQGQDVKALVLISPPWNFRGLDLQPALNHPVIRGQLPLLMLVGQAESRFLSDAKRVYAILERARPGDADLPANQKTLYFGQLGTKLQGTSLLGVPQLNVEAILVRFIELQVVKRDYPWSKRQAPGQK